MSRAARRRPRAVVVTASNRAAAGVYEDRSGQALAEGLRELGFDVEGPHVRPDDVGELEAVLRAAVDAGFDVVLTTGGTGLSPTDVTPEATRAGARAGGAGHRRGGPPVRRGERRADVGAVPRAWPAPRRRTLIVNLPGSTGGVRDALAVLGPLLPHVVSQLRGGDHVIGRLEKTVAADCALPRSRGLAASRGPRCGSPGRGDWSALHRRPSSATAPERRRERAAPAGRTSGFRVSPTCGHPFCLVIGSSQAIRSWRV